MSSSSDRPLNRREFISQASCAAVGSTALFSTLLTLRLANSLAAQTVSTSGDYRALVCLFLAGGNDSFNMLVPTTSGEYEAYAKKRGPLALTKETLLEITPSNLGGRTLGIHPAMPEVRDLFNERRLSFISNVGSLVRPLNMADYRAGRYLTVSLYSHADQAKQWQTCMPDQRTAIGWGGRAADIIKSLNGPNLISMNISLSGQNVFLTGKQAFTYAVGANGATALTGYSPTAVNNLTALRTKGVSSIVDQNYRNLFEQTYAQSTSDAVDSYYSFAAALSGVTLKTPIPAGNSLATNLATIARVISSNQGFGARRQIFFVQIGGWDNHTDLFSNQQNNLGMVSKAINTFSSALTEIGMADKVTLFTASDFGRTLSSNSTGSDHAWGANHLVMGGAVNGGKVAGDSANGYYPDFQKISEIDTGAGRIIPGIAVDEYARDLLSWFGISNGDMDYVLPAFSTRFSGRQALGLFPSPITVAPTVASTATASSGGGGGGGGGAASPIFLGALSALALLRLRQKRLAKRKAKDVPPPTT